VSVYEYTGQCHFEAAEMRESPTAASAASRVAASYGYRVERPVVLQETNNTVVWLRPHAIIAKVGKWGHSAEALVREHAVAATLAQQNAPIGPPVSGAGPRLDEETGFVVTLWQRLDHNPALSIPGGDLATCLRRFHDHLARYPGELPPFWVELGLARRALGDDRIMAALKSEDRSMLREAFDWLLSEVEAYRFTEQPLHGEPHRGNVLATPVGLRWIDLEGVCVGPLEWDLAFLPQDAVRTFPTFDSELLTLVRALTSAQVATWCWSRPEFPEMRQHGKYHLEQVRRGIVLLRAR
jgi:phosphotransferase family enzyme